MVTIQEIHSVTVEVEAKNKSAAREIASKMVASNQVDLFNLFYSHHVVKNKWPVVKCINPKCRKCGGEMKAGMALQNKFSGLPDFPDDTSAATISRSGPPKMVNVYKCIKCGHSFEKNQLKNK